jgi:lysophospholipase L1-like esterase
MRIRFVGIFLCAAAILSAAVGARAQAPATYYLALGDSLAQGVQLGPTGDVITNQGYADDLYAQFQPRIPGLQLAKLGCPGETTTSMIEGGVCPYPEGNQLAAAVSFLKTHTVSFVTIDIGANDVDGCISSTGAIDQNCVQAGFKSTAANLPYILGRLKLAAPHAQIVGMNYYDPFLAAWTLVANGKAVATESLASATEFNVILGSIYKVFGVPVADVATAFRTYNFAAVPVENLPVNVFMVLSWTYMGAPPPLGPDFHCNAAGYAAIAGAFASQITLH